MSTVRIAVIGAGPSGISFLERLGANRADLLGDRRIEVHLIDPYPAGPGRIWREDQSRSLWMNSMAGDVTMYTDDSVVCDGPILTGPTLVEWAAHAASATTAEPDLTAELKELTPTTFPTRKLQSAYLSWVYHDVTGRFAEQLHVLVHPGLAVDIGDLSDGAQRVTIDMAVPSGDAAREFVDVDVVVLTLGHPDLVTGDEDAEIESFAAANGLAYLPPTYTADVDLSEFRPRSDVIVRGMGLAAIDVTVLLTEGRGGRYSDHPDGSLTYHPSGDEPHLIMGSRRGVPYHSKLVYPLQGPKPKLPRFFGPEAVGALLAGTDLLDFRRDVWPLLSKEILWAYYHELFAAHPERTTVAWDYFDHQFELLPGASPEQDELVAKSVPMESDRFDIDSFDRPLAGRCFSDHQDLQRYLRTHIEKDLSRRADPTYSADLGAFNALLVSFAQVGRIAVSGRLDITSRRNDVDGWWRGFFSYYASGPPARRLQELLALSRAGVVEFLGADMWVTTGPDGRFHAGGSSSPLVVTAGALIEARNPGASVRRNRSELVQNLYRRGEMVEETLVDQATGARYETGKILVSKDLRLIDERGRAHPRRVALGYPTSRPAAGTFSRPWTNAAAFRQNDLVARSVLSILAEVVPT
jgi:hypothetical protein